MAVINTNTKALFSQNALKASGKVMAKSMEQLSTGKRINTAGDDAAGLAISTRMTQQIRALNQAVRNAGDAISLIQTAEGATGEMTNMLQRMRELAIQAINDTNSDPDRSYLDLEFQQLKQEVVRISEMTEWNGFKVLNGTAGERVGEVPVYKATSVNLAGDVLINPTTLRTVEGADGGEKRTVTFTGTTESGYGVFRILGETFQIDNTVGQSPTDFADAVASHLRSREMFNASSGRTVTAENGVLTFTFAATDQEIEDFSIQTPFPGMEGEIAVTRYSVTAPEEVFSGNAGFITSGSLSITIPSTGTNVSASFTTSDNEVILMSGVLDVAEGTVTFSREAGNNRQVFSGSLGLDTSPADTLVYQFSVSDDESVAADALTNRAVSLNVDVSGTIPAMRSGDLKINGIDIGASYATDDLTSPRANAAGSAIAKAAAINRAAASTGITVGESQSITLAGVPKTGVIKVAGIDITITSSEDTSVKAAAKIATALRGHPNFAPATGRSVSYAPGGSIINIDFSASEGDVGTIEVLPGTTGFWGLVDVTRPYATSVPGTGVFAKVNENVVTGQAMDASSVVRGVVWINGFASAGITTVLNNTRETRLNVVNAINAISHRTGVKAIDTGYDSMGVTLIAQDGRNIEVTFETTSNETLFGRRIGLREGVQSSTISLESKIQTPVVLTAASTGDIGRVGLLEGNFTKNQSVYNTAPRAMVEPAAAQTIAVTLDETTDFGFEQGDTFELVVNGQTFESSSEAESLQEARDDLVAQVNQALTSNPGLGVMAFAGRTPKEIMLKAVVPGVAFTLTTATSDTDETTIETVTIQDSRPAAVKPLTQDDLVINGIRIRPSRPGDDTKSIVQPFSSDRASSALAIAAAINSHSKETGVRALPNGAVAKGMFTTTAGLPADEEVANYTVYVNGIAIDVEFKKNEPELDRRTKVVTAINARSGQHGVKALDNGYGINLETDGRNLSVWFDANVSGLTPAHFGLDNGDAVAQQTRLAITGSGSDQVTISVNGVAVTVDEGANAEETAAAFLTAVSENEAITNIRVERSGSNLIFTSTVPGTPFELLAVGMEPASETSTSLTVVSVTDNDMGSNLMSSIRGTTEVPASESRMAKTAYGTVRLISDAALLPNLPSPVGAPPSDREALLRASAKPFTVKVGVDGFGVNGNFNALGFQEGAFGGRSSEAMDPPKVGRLAFQVGSSAQQLITIDLADFGKNGDITASITGDVDLNVEQRSARINSRDGANNVLQLLDEVMDKINATRAQMGAVMNRLQYAMDNLSNVSMNQEASRSQIQDADYAKASTELAKSQIMQQAATAVLAQANMSQQTVLQLLQG